MLAMFQVELQHATIRNVSDKNTFLSMQFIEHNTACFIN